MHLFSIFQSMFLKYTSASHQVRAIQKSIQLLLLENTHIVTNTVLKEGKLWATIF